jgi:hypothetical protein
LASRGVRPKSDIAQCSLQRGFTQNSAPINAAFIMEESRRVANDMEEQLIIIMLDAKSAFDVVVHNNIMRDYIIWEYKISIGL